jgi:PPM family protein phosphatase
MVATDTRVIQAATDRKPRDDEIDFFGMTHPGKVRTVNEDHFLICSMRKRVELHLTSLPDPDRLPLGAERVALLAAVADGVGGGAMGEEAARFAVEAVTQYIARTMRCYSAADDADGQAFAEALQSAARECHEELVQRAAANSMTAGMATTLTLWIGMWPRAYLLHVGDSRCYLLERGELRQLSRDQTMAQELVDMGVMSRTRAFGSRLAHVLSSSLGGPQTAPVVHCLDQRWGTVGLLCSDGLTKHVSDERIHERLATMTSARQTCADLIQDALDAGGTDNITVVAGRSVRRDEGSRGVLAG